MRVLVLMAAAVSLSYCSDLLQLTSDFTFIENTGRIRVCNFVNCWGKDNLHLVKRVSSNFRCFITVNPPDRPLSEWYIHIQLQLFVVDLSCPGTEEFLKEAEGFGLFNGNVVWLVVDSNEYTNDTRLAARDDSAPSALKLLDMTITSQVNVAFPVEEGKYEITGYYRRDPLDELIREDLGYWAADEGLVFTAVTTPAIRRQNLGRRLFRASIVLTNNDSLNHMFDLVDLQTDSITKINYVYFDLVLDAMNATAEFITASKWGSNISGTFDGMIGHIPANKSEILVSSLLLSKDRMEIIQYMPYTLTVPTGFIFLSPPLSYKNNIYLLPFGADVWVSVLALFIAFTLALYVVTARGNGELQTGNEIRQPTEKQLRASFSDIALFNWATMCQQDAYTEPTSVAGRVTALFLKITVLFLYVYYSAAILVLLQSSDTSISTLLDLDKSNLRLGAHDTSYNRFYLKHPANPRQAVIGVKVHNRDFVSVRKGIEMVRSGRFAFLVDRTLGQVRFMTVRELFEQSEMCQLQELKENYMESIDTMVGLKKNLPYAEIVNIMYKKVFESGMAYRERTRRTAKKPPCRDRTMSYISVGLIDAESAFVALLFGLAASSCVLLAEIIFFKSGYYKSRKTMLFEYCD